MAAKSETDLEARSIVTTRIFDAPRALVFQAWSDAKHLANWWGPNGFTTTTKSFDFRPGGEWRFVMHGPDGRDYDNRIAFDEIMAPERISYRHMGTVDTDPVHFSTTVTFEDVGGKTRLTMRGVFPTVEERNRVAKEFGAVEGAQQTIARLADYVGNLGRKAKFIFLSGEPIGLIIREFDAPRALVWEAMTSPQHIPHWWGPYRYETIVKEMDCRSGGKWRFVNRAPDGSSPEFEFFGEYRDVKPQALVIQTFAFGEFPPALETMVLYDLGHKTRMEVIARYDSARVARCDDCLRHGERRSGDL